MKRSTLFNNLIQKINLPLLLFLIFFLNVKFVVKLVAIVVFMIYSRNLHLGLSWKKSRLPFFYALIILIECFKYLIITRVYSLPYLLVFTLGLIQWLMCLLAIHYLKLTIERNEQEKIQYTIKAFYFLNFIVSFFFLSLLIIHPAWLAFWGHGTELSFSHPSAGDAILGLSFDASTVNAAINCLGLIYFLHRKDNLFAILCTLVIIFCTSNLIFLLTCVVLVAMIITVKSKMLRLRSIAFALGLIILYALFSPRNRVYMHDYFVQLYVVNKEKQPIDTSEYPLESDDSNLVIARRLRMQNDSIYGISDKKLEQAIGNLMSFRGLREDPKTGYALVPESIYQTKPGKLVSFVQTFYYLKHSMKQFLFGSGIGNFSSKLAFRAAGVRTSGSYPAKYRYASRDFQHNHFLTFLNYYGADASKHSVLNYPFSVYNQVLGEYGFIGLIIFALFYLGYFLRAYRKLTFGKYIILALLGFFLTDYWFEYFSLVIVFELLILVNLSEASGPPPSIHPG